MRIIALTHDWHVIGDLDFAKVVSIKVIDEVNGENALEIVTLQELAKGDRLLWRDGMDVWHEYVVNGISSYRIGPSAVAHQYYCPWSIQVDLSGTTTTAMPGTGGVPASATTALQGALQGTDRWGIGTVEPTKTSSASFWRMSGWDAMRQLVSVWGGEIRADITVTSNYVITRQVSLLNHVGSSTATRRYDYGADIAGITRDVLEEPWTCRVIPLGAAEEAEGGGYGRKITIESVNGGVAWLENADTVNATRLPDGQGGWEYPTQHVENPEATTPQELMDWALANLTQWTTPKVSYALDAVQLASAGSASGVACGDEVIVVDAAFGSSGIRIQARVVRIELDLLDPSATSVTISNVPTSLGLQLTEVAQVGANAVTLIEKTNDYLRTIIRDSDDGTLVCHVGGDYGALVNADGSFDVVALTWDGDEPTVGDWWATMGPEGFEYITRDASGEPHLLIKDDTLEMGFVMGYKLTWSSTDGLKMRHRSGNVPITDLWIQQDGTPYSTHFFGWHQLATTSGTTPTSFDTSFIVDMQEFGYNGLLIVAKYGTTYTGSVVVPIQALSSTASDWYLGGWTRSTTYAAACSLTTDRMVPYQIYAGGGAVNADWVIYAR